MQWGVDINFIGVTKKMNKRNIIIYILGLLLSFALLGLYFINPQNPWCTIFVSVGASGIGAVILAWLIEWSNEKTRAESRKAIRLSKLYLVDFFAIRLLERLVFGCFRKREKIFNARDKKTCYRITFDELWKELHEQEYYLDLLRMTVDTSLPDSLQATDKEICKICESFSKYLDSNIAEFITFEAAGYFSDSEISSLRSVKWLIQYVYQNEDGLDENGLKHIFDCLTEFKEFDYLKTMVFYYKDRKVDYVSSRKDKEPHFSDEDRNAAVSASERKSYPAIPK